MVQVKNNNDFNEILCINYDERTNKCTDKTLFNVNTKLDLELRK